MWLLHQTSRLSSTPTPFALSFKSKSVHQGIFREKVPFLQRRLVHPGGCQGFAQLKFASIEGRGSPVDLKSRHKYGNTSWAEGQCAPTPPDCGQHVVSPLFVFHKYPTWFLYLHDCWIHSFKVYCSLCLPNSDYPLSLFCTEKKKQFPYKDYSCVDSHIKLLSASMAVYDHLDHSWWLQQLPVTEHV